jgi:hypothetical protein
MYAVVLVAAVTSCTVLVAFLSFLVFCAFVVVRTGNTSGLKDVAVAVRAFRGVLTFRGGKS